MYLAENNHQSYAGTKGRSFKLHTYGYTSRYIINLHYNLLKTKQEIDSMVDFPKSCYINTEKRIGFDVQIKLKREKMLI